MVSMFQTDDSDSRIYPQKLMTIVYKDANITSDESEEPYGANKFSLVHIFQNLEVGNHDYA